MLMVVGVSAGLVIIWIFALLTLASVSGMFIACGMVKTSRVIESVGRSILMAPIDAVVWGWRHFLPLPVIGVFERLSGVLKKPPVLWAGRAVFWIAIIAICLTGLAGGAALISHTLNVT